MTDVAKASINHESLPKWRRKAQLPTLVVAVGLLGLAGWMLSARWIAMQPLPKRQFVNRSSNFDFSELKIPREEVFSGGPPKDGIPALTDPAS